MYLLFLWHLYLMVLRAATSLLGALEGVARLKTSVARLKTITYRAIKTTGTLIVIKQDQRKQTTWIPA